ncbi:hypothetical protein C5689_12880 [Methylosinus sporium]|uniref:Uncharacterized protein n=1 Tax=Methylosinus sporium TaxID=428 RepID=A0A2U1SPI9_METSR|nr:hypothetical protein C5689_12880 [Methylosinus sporium]
MHDRRRNCRKTATIKDASPFRDLAKARAFVEPPLRAASRPLHELATDGARFPGPSPPVAKKT